jgi:NADP-dependent 3-hydroxy acid dehydrogenase YdfG
MPDAEDKSELCALVTGASSGIGRAIAIAIAATGGVLCLVGRDRERLKKTALVARPMAREVTTFSADLSVDQNITELVKHVEEKVGSINVLIHCAAAHVTGPVDDVSVDHLDLLYRTNVRAPYALTRALLPMLKPAKGQIVFVNSSQGLQARGNVAAYAATKHALKAIADSLREEVNENGIRVLSIYPGRTATPTIEALYKIKGQTYRPDLLLQPGDIAQVIVNLLGLPRTAEVTNLEIRPHIKSY